MVCYIEERADAVRSALLFFLRILLVVCFVLNDDRVSVAARKMMRCVVEFRVFPNKKAP